MGSQSPSVSNFEFLFITVEIPMGHKKYSKNNCIFLNIYLGKKANEQSFHSVEVLSADITWTCDSSPQVSVWAWRQVVHLCSRHARPWPGEHLCNFTWCLHNTFSPWKLLSFSIFSPCAYIWNSLSILSYSHCYQYNYKSKTNSKFERTGRRTGNSLLHHGVFFPFSRIFPLSKKEDSISFLLYALLLFLELWIKKNSKFEREGKGTEKSKVQQPYPAPKFS